MSKTHTMESILDDYLQKLTSHEMLVFLSVLDDINDITSKISVEQLLIIAEREFKKRK